MLKIKTSSPVVAPIPDLLGIIEEWLEYKRREDELRALRLTLGQAFSVLEAPQEGQKKYAFGDYRIVRKNAIHYRGDAQRVAQLCADLEVESPTRLELHGTACKQLRKDQPVAFELLSEEGAIVTSVAMPQFEVSKVR